MFLAYGTTSAVARHVGAGSPTTAVATGVDGIWLAAGLGVITGVLVGALAPGMVALFGASAGASDQATTYLRVSALGIPGMLVVLAVTGVLRGLQDTRAPLVVSALGFGANIALNVVLVLGLGLGIAGSAWGTVLAQTGMAAALVWVVVRRTRGRSVPLRPRPLGVLRAGLDGIPLLVRTLALRAVLLLTTWVAAGLGETALAAHQVAMTVWSLLAFALDALAIAAQALTGKALGAHDSAGAREMMVTMVRWGVWCGAVLGLGVVLGRGVIPLAFTEDAAVRAPLAAALLVVGLSTPVSGLVFVLDGVLIGAGDGRWLAYAQTLVLALYLPVALALRHYCGTPSGEPGQRCGTTPAAPVTLLWLGFCTFLLSRALLLGRRARSDAWLITGAQRRNGAPGERTR